MQNQPTPRDLAAVLASSPDGPDDDEGSVAEPLVCTSAEIDLAEELRRRLRERMLAQPDFAEALDEAAASAAARSDPH
jgi:hypothetical protein